MPVTVADIDAAIASFDWDEWEQALNAAFGDRYREMVFGSAEEAAAGLGVTFDPKDPFLSEHLTGYVGERIKQLNGTTRDQVTAALQREFDATTSEGLTTFEIGSSLLSTVRETFTDYERFRSDRIARTESAIALNTGAVGGYRQAGIDEVLVSDGDDDEECAAADGQTWSLDEALADPIAHPNCVRSFSPVISDDTASEAD